MGFFNKVLGTRGAPTHQDAPADAGAPVHLCPDCGEELSPDPLIAGAYECLNEDCTDDADLPTAAIVPGECPWCQSSLSGGERYLPYEDGSNEDAYVICPGCKQKILQ
jgi:hypothetical protein